MSNIPVGYRLLAKLAPTWQKYESGKSYEYLDAVSYEGSTYLALKNTPIVPPQEGSDWLLIAAKGDQGKAGNDGHTPTKEEWELDKVENADIETILSHITIELLESLLGVKDLRSVLSHKLDDTTEIVNGIRGGLDEPYQHGDVTVDKAFIGLPNVDDLSLLDILKQVREQVRADELGGVQKVEDQGYKAVYTSDGDETTTLEVIDDLKRIIRLFNGEQTNDGPNLITADTLLAFLCKFYTHYSHEEFIRLYQPLLKIRGEAEIKEGVWHSGEWTVTKKSLGLENVPNISPDKVGSGLPFSGVCISDSKETTKIIRADKGFTLQPGRIVNVTFNQTNLAYPLYLQINNTGRRMLKINGELIKKSTAQNFRKGGTYQFIYQDGCWNLVYGSTKVKSEINETLTVDKWQGTGPYYYSLSITDRELYGDEDYDLFTAKNITEVERQNFMFANIQGYDQSKRGITLRADEKPMCDLPVYIQITRQFNRNNG